MAEPPVKAAGAFRTIGELSAELGVAPHVLRYWETRFPQLKPLQRAGNRRYYRAEDAALARRIHQWLTVDGYTVKGVQALLARDEPAVPVEPPPAASPSSAPPPIPVADDSRRAALVGVRDLLLAALAQDNPGPA